MIGGGLLVAASPPVLPAAAVDTAPPTQPCVVGATVEENGRAWSCVDASGVATWVDLGHTRPALVEYCTAGTVERFDGYTWLCRVGTSGVPEFVKTRPWRQPTEFVFGRGAPPRRPTLTMSTTSGLTGCRLTASEPRLLRRARQPLQGRTARVALDTSGLDPRVVSVNLTCPDSRLNQYSDILIRSDATPLLRSDCLDAWHDDKYGEVVPGYGRRLSPAVATRTHAECRRLKPLTLAEMNRVSAEAFLRVGLIAEREVRRVSAERQIPICQAIADVFMPLDSLGRRVLMSPSGTTATGPIAGYAPGGFFPILTRQWTDGPFRLKNTAGCGSGNQALRLYNTTWMGCPALGDYGAFDPKETYPAFDASACPSAVAMGDRPDASVCIVWGERIGNDVVAGVGKVFSARGPLPNDALSCQDRFLRAGSLANIADIVMTPLDSSPRLRRL